MTLTCRERGRHSSQMVGLAVVVSLLYMCDYVSAQSALWTDLHVRVLDGAGSPISGATVALLEDEPNDRSAKTNESGDATLKSVACDPKQAIEVTAAEFGTVRITNLTSCEHVNEILTVCLSEQVITRIVLRCPGPVVDLEKSHKSMTFSSQALADLPGVGGDAREALVKVKTKKQPKCQQLSWYGEAP